METAFNLPLASVIELYKTGERSLAKAAEIAAHSQTVPPGCALPAIKEKFKNYE